METQNDDFCGKKHEQTRDFKLELAGITKPHLSQFQEVGRRHVHFHAA